jgi:YHS domain-containing protein
MTETRTQAEPKTQTKVKDLVCGMNVDPATTKFRTEHEGTTYYFCSESCKSKFDVNPAPYIRSQK